MKFDDYKAALLVLIFASSFSVAAQDEPYLELRLNVPNVIKAVDRAKLKAEKEAAADAAELGIEVDDAMLVEDGPGAASEVGAMEPEAFLTIIKGLNVETAHLFLYPDKEFQTVPVLLIKGVKQSEVEALLAAQGLIGDVLERVGPGFYKFKEDPMEKEAAEEDEDSSIPTDRFRLWIRKDSAIVAPVSVLRSWNAGEARPLSTAVGKLGTGLSTDTSLLSLAVRLPETLSKDLDKGLKENPLLAGTGSEDITDLVAQMLASVVDPLTKVKALGLRFSIREDESRLATYVQWYKKPLDAQTALKTLQAGTASQDADGIVSTLLEIAEDEATRTSHSAKDGMLRVNVAWTEEKDEVIGGILMGAIMEMALGGMGVTVSAGPDGSDGPVVTKYVPAPKIDDSVTSTTLQAFLKAELGKKLFPGHFWANGEKPKMSVECDFLNYPNAALCKLTYDVVGVTAPDGSSLLREEENRFSEIRNRREYSAPFNLPVTKGTKKEQLGKATVRFTLLAPTELTKFSFTASDIGKGQDKNGVTILPKRISGSSASIKFNGCKSVKLFATDETGQYLDDSSSSWSGQSMTTSFHGDISTLHAVAIKDLQPIVVDATIDLLKGEGMKLPKEPSTDIRDRYDYTPVPSFKEYRAADLAGWKCIWDEDEGEEFDGDLMVQIKEDSFKGEYDWKVLYFGKDAPLAVKGNGGWNGGFSGAGSRINYYAQDGEEAGIHAALGQLKLTVPAKMEVLKFNKATDGAPLAVTTPAGTNITVTFNKNHVTVTGPESQMLSTQAFDASGEALKDGGASWMGEGRTVKYWGQPTRVVIHFADEQLKHAINVSLTRDGVDAAAFAAFKGHVKAAAGAAETLKLINDARSKGRMNVNDDTLAGDYYLLNKEEKPSKLIDRAIANSDPAGAKRYGYTVKPYKGYYFTVAKGTSKDGKDTAYERLDGESELKWEGGTLSMKPLGGRAAIIAIPADTKGASLTYSSWGHASFRFMGDKKIEYIPDGAWPKGWTAARELPVIESATILP